MFFETQCCLDINLQGMEVDGHPLWSRRESPVNRDPMTMSIWPWKPVQQFSLTWWIFVAGFIRNPSTE